MQQIVVFVNDYHGYGRQVPRRVVSGDIVGYMSLGRFYVDQTDSWLFPWEKDDPDCYARRQQAKGSFKLQLL